MTSIWQLFVVYAQCLLNFSKVSRARLHYIKTKGLSVRTAQLLNPNLVRGQSKSVV